MSTPQCQKLWVWWAKGPLMPIICIGLYWGMRSIEGIRLRNYARIDCIVMTNFSNVICRMYGHLCQTLDSLAWAWVSGNFSVENKLWILVVPIAAWQSITSSLPTIRRTPNTKLPPPTLFFTATWPIRQPETFCHVDEQRISRVLSFKLKRYDWAQQCACGKVIQVVWELFGFCVHGQAKCQILERQDICTFRWPNLVEHPKITK